jgi:IMP dehydrogenase
MKSFSEAMTFDDFLLKPQFSNVESRSQVNVDGLLVSANMKDITGMAMCRTMTDLKQIGCLHRFWSIQENLIHYEQLVNEGCEVWASVGFEKERVSAISFIKKDSIVVVDVAHGYTKSMLDFIIWIQENYPDLKIIAGNFAEFPGAILNDSRVKPIYGIKIGIGPGSACTTRSVTGHGYPQQQAIRNTVEVLKAHGHKHKDIMVIADGGCKNSGDIAKALAAGAHKVMIGGLLAFTDDCNNPYRYAGSASLESYEETNKKSEFRAPEGVAQHSQDEPTSTKAKVQDILSGLRSAFSYSDSFNLEDFHKKAQLVKVSGQTILENSTRKW